MAELNDIQLRIIVNGTGLDNVDKLHRSLSNIIGNVKESGNVAAGASSKWTQFGDALSQLERRFDAVFRAASHLQALGRDLTGMGEAGLGMLKGAVDAWGDYEFAVHRAAGALGIFDTTSPIFHRLQEAIDETAQEARLFPAEEIAKAVYYWGSATGQTVENNEDLAIVMKGLLPIMQTAAITETDYEKAIKGTYQIIQQYRLGLSRLATEQDVAAGRATHVGEEMSNVADITEKLMMITQNTAAEYSDLVEAFKYTGTIAPALGVEWEDLAKVLGRLSDLGIRGSQAGRGLQQTFTKLVDPTVKASKALDTAWQNAYGLGQTFEKMVFPNGEFIGLTEYIDQLADVTEEMTQQERNQLIAIMTTQNELRTMVPLIEDQIRARREGISVYDSEKFALEQAAAQFEKTMHLLEISWQGTMGYLSNTIGPVVRAIGSEVARLATPFVEQIGLILNQIKMWMDTHPEIVEWGVKLLAIASVAAIVAGSIFTAVGVLLAFGAGIAFVVKGAGMFMGIFTRVVPVIGLVIGVVTALATNFGGLRDAAERVIQGIVGIFKAMDDGTAGAGLSGLERIGEALLPMLETVAKLAAAALNLVADALEWIARTPGAVKVVEGIVTALSVFMAAGFAARIGGVAVSILTLGGNAFGATPYLKGLASAMARFFSISSLWPPNLIKNFKDLSTAIYVTSDDAVKKLGSAKSAIVRALSSIGPAAASAAATLKGSMAGMVAATRAASTAISLSIKSVLIATGIGAIIVAIALLVEAWVNNWGNIQGIVGDAVDWVVARFNEFAGWVSSVWTTITGTISTAVTNIVNFFRDLPTTIGTFLSQVWTNITTWVGNVAATIASLPGKAWQSIVDGFTAIFTFLGEWWNGLGETTAERVGYVVGRIIALPILVIVKIVGGFLAIAKWLAEWWSKLMDATAEFVIMVVDVIVTWISQLPGHIADFFGMVWDFLVNWWNSTIKSVTAWVTSTVNAIVTWISQLPGRFANFFGQVWNNVSSWFGKFISSVGTWASQAVNNIITFIQQLPGKVMSWFGSLFTKVSTWFTTQLIPYGGQWALNAVTEMVKFFKQLPGKVIDGIALLVGKLGVFLKELPGKVWSALLSVGKAIIDGIWRGISNAWSTFWNNVWGFFKGIVEGVKDGLGIKSPSTVFADIGDQIMAGLNQGIDRNHDAAQSMHQQINQLLNDARRVRTMDFEPLDGNFGFEATGEKHLVIEHRVSSPDGTVDRTSQEQIKEIFTADEFVSALEHMAVTG